MKLLPALALTTALFFSNSCDKLGEALGPGDKLDRPGCTVTNANDMSCNRINHCKTGVRFQLGGVLDACVRSGETPIGITVTAPGDINSYTFTGSGGEIRQHTNKKDSEYATIGTQITGDIVTNLPDVPATLHIRTITAEGTKKILATFSLTNCTR